MLAVVTLGACAEKEAETELSPEERRSAAALLAKIDPPAAYKRERSGCLPGDLTRCFSALAPLRPADAAGATSLMRRFGLAVETERLTCRRSERRDRPQISCSGWGTLAAFELGFTIFSGPGARGIPDQTKLSMTVSGRAR